MGGNGSKRKTKTRVLDPRVSGFLKNVSKNQQIQKNELQQYFGNRTILCKGMLKLVSKGDTISRNMLTALAELLVVDQDERICKKFQNTSIGTEHKYIMLYLGECGAEGEDLTSREIDLKQAGEMLKLLVEILGNSGNVDKAISSNLIKSIFRDAKKVSFSKFFKRLEKQIDVLGRFMRIGLESIIKHPNNSPSPRYELGSSHLLNPTVLALLGGTNTKFFKTESLFKLYSTSDSGSSFNRLAFALNGYAAPSLLFLQHSYKLTNGQQQTGLLGVYVNPGWQDGLQYYGSSECFLFTLLPEFRVMYAFTGKGGKSYVYMNSKKIAGSKYKAGLGFGGEDYDNWRLWIDDDMMNESYTTSQGLTYPFGVLSPGYDKKLRVCRVEVWGLGDDSAIARRKAVRDMDEARVMKARKINRKEMFDGGAGTVLTKLFEHRENMRLDMDVILDEQFGDKEKR